MKDFTELLQTVKAMEPASAGFNPVKIRVLRNYTIEGIEPFLKHHLYANRLNPEIVFGGYNSAQQEIFTELQPVKDTLEIVVLTVLLDQIDSDYNMPDWDITAGMNYLQGLLSSLAAQTTATVVLNTFPLPGFDETGIVGGPHSITQKIQRMNGFLCEYAAQNSSQFVVVDWNRIVRRIGEAQAFDTRNHFLFLAPFRPAFLYEYAKEIAVVVRALAGKTKKCVVLDCDNTLWGGIIGEDGPEGIQLDRNHYPGKAFYEFQKSILHLHRRGVMVALCSKNNPEDVWEVLDQHPYCLLKKQHLSAWRINWEDKAHNIRQLAQQLNIGLDSLVFVDDNPSECELIRQLCPEVVTLQVPQKLSVYPALLLQDGLFDTLAVSAEDRRRTQMVQEQESRQAAKETSKTLADYLLSLQTEITVRRATREQAARIAQLTQKTNQFNLTTRRYSESEIVRMAEDQDRFFVAAMTVRDRFGDLGLTGVFIAKRQNSVMDIDTFLLSCRVLGRDVEKAFLQQCIAQVEQAALFERWETSYVPTAKNSQTADFWLKAGFKSMQKLQRYSLAYGQFSPMDLPHIHVVGEEKKHDSDS